MRRGKKPTRKQKIRLGQAGLAPENWLVVKQKANGELIILNNICPLCGRAYDEPPALSRVDNQTDICPRCGMMEALAAMPRRETPQDRTRRAVYATGNRWAIENFEATHH